MTDKSPGTLYVVPTPIGNLNDLSLRALEVLRQAQLILAEDTRHFRKLAERFALTAPVISYHEHNERARTAQLIGQLQEGTTVALVSDAGTPAINDPGYHLIRAAQESHLPVCGLPGPSAITTALSICGFNASPFAFFGFVPQKPGKRESILRQTLGSAMTSVFFESPHRIVKTLAVLAELEPGRLVFVARELTKLHEETLRGSALDIAGQLASRSSLKGEFVFVIEGKRRGNTSPEDTDRAED